MTPTSDAAEARWISGRLTSRSPPIAPNPSRNWRAGSWSARRAVPDSIFTGGADGRKKIASVAAA